jgi:uncharacterized protein (TIGR03067 family)
VPARRMLIALTIVAITMLLAGPAARAGDDDAKLLQGPWRVVSAKHNGGERRKETVPGMLVTIEGDRVHVQLGGGAADQEAKFTIDPAKTPKQIDFAAQAREGVPVPPTQDLFARFRWTDKGAVPVEGKAEGIYKLDGDRLTMCWRTTAARELLPTGGVSKESAVRPSVFRSDLYYHQYLYVLERAGHGK